MPHEPMPRESNDLPFTASSSVADTSVVHDTVHRMAQAAPEAVNRLEKTLGAGSDRMIDWQQEYGDLAREPIRSNPLVAVGIALGVGFVISRLLAR